jgi:hypothetical protein
MKPFIALCLLCTLFTCQTTAQITIGPEDMPSPGDTIRVSVTSVVPEGFQRTAMDTSWNFQMLEALSQRVDTFVSATSTPAGYQLIFVLLGGANLASPRNSIPIPMLPFTNGYSFYKNNETSFSDLGVAYTFQGFPISLRFDQPDKVYQFPLQPNHTWNSTSMLELPVPGMFFYRTEVNRANLADGYGQLTTPYGTFETIRIKSTVEMHDTIWVDSIQTGFSFDRVFTEYKWLGKDQGIPLLVVREEGPLVSATWRDIPRMPVNTLAIGLGPDTSVAKGTELVLTAEVTGGTPPYNILWSTLDTGHTITVQILSDTSFTAIVFDAQMNISTASQNIALKYPPGFEELSTIPVKIFPNPTAGIVYFSLPGSNDRASLDIISVNGETVVSGLRIDPGIDNIADLSMLPEGIYLVVGTSCTRRFSGKIEITGKSRK